MVNNVTFSQVTPLGSGSLMRVAEQITFVFPMTRYGTTIMMALMTLEVLSTEQKLITVIMTVSSLTLLTNRTCLVQFVEQTKQ